MKKLINSVINIEAIDDRLRDGKGRIREFYPTNAHDPDVWGYSDGERTANLVNHNNDFEDELEYEILGAYFNERHYQPRKQKMRVRWNRGKQAVIEWWDERRGDCGRTSYNILMTRIDGHISKWVGRKFDDCFSDLKRKFLTNKDWRRQGVGIGACRQRRDKSMLWVGIRDHFLSNFEGRWGDYTVNDGGLIEKLPSRRQPPYRNITVYEGDAYYIPKPKALQACKPLFDILPSRMFQQLMLSAKVDMSTIQRLESEIRSTVDTAFHYSGPNKITHTAWSALPGKLVVIAKKRYSWWEACRAVTNYCFEFVDERTTHTIKYHSKEWYLLKGKRPKPKKVDRSAEYDRSLWVQKYLKNHNNPYSFHDMMRENPDELKLKKFRAHTQILLKCHRTYWWLENFTYSEIARAIQSMIDDKWYLTNRFPNMFHDSLSIELVDRIKKLKEK